MEKKISREMDMKTIRETYKKTVVKDRGDLKKNNYNPFNAEIEINNELKRELNVFLPDRGDSRLTKRSEYAKKINDTSTKDAIKNEKSVPNRTYLDLEGRKLLRERYTIRFKNSDVKAENKVNIKIEQKPDEESPANDKSKDSVFTNSRPDKKLVKEAPCQRKLSIKTVTDKNDSRLYKAVTFVDQKQHTPLQIKMSNIRKEKAKEVNLNLSKEALKVKEKPLKKVIKRRKKRVVSPAFQKGNASPPTEVAKWAPSCINHHTQPYYEAWVDTTLAAISKCSKDKLFLEKQNIITTFQRALMERPDTPDLVYEKNDERYTGRIIVRQR